MSKANDSYWLPNDKVRLEGYARIIGCEKCERTLRTRMVYRYRAVAATSFGSSHIQGVAFGNRGRLIARTILSYGQSTDPTSPWSHDQTRLFSREKWVAFPFTGAQVDRQRISRQVVRS